MTGPSHPETTMKIPFCKVRILDFSALDEQISKFEELRDSYHEANRAHYGEVLAALLND
jgi:hypothetical protein